jgi:MoaA/NifB/PqqE/SkfB family radical SAM enzyme
MRQLSQRILQGVNQARAALPEAVCFRVTRYCNARCGFCLAPPDGSHPDVATLAQRIHWLRSRGVRTIHFCGGEPTIHPGLATLIEHVHAGDGRTLLTTNGITIQDELISVLRRHGTRVKVSLHGDHEHHDRMVGCKAFHATTGNLRRLLAANVAASVQTTIVSGGEWVVEWTADFCRSIGVRQLSILPFIPRGSGALRRNEYELSAYERHSLRDLVRRQRKAFAGILEIKWLDFTARPVMVAEADGTLVLEAATEMSDQIVCRIPNTGAQEMIHPAGSRRTHTNAQ